MGLMVSNYNSLPPLWLVYAVVQSNAHCLIWYYNILSTLLQLHPKKRISAIAAIQHRYFADLPYQLFELQDGKCA